MISPIDILLDPISLIIIAMYILLFTWERLFPRNKHLPDIKYATLRGLIGFGVFFFLSSYLPLLTDTYLAQYQIFDLSTLHMGLQIGIGLLFYEGMLYLWHWAMHKNNVLWRVFHQMHHSAEKVDIPSTFYFSPMDMIAFTLLGSFVFAFVMGVDPRSATVVIISLNFLSIFQHANIKTPQWLGYIIQRPEQHAVHHERGVHKYNYSDFPLYDMIFGTFNNPKDHQGQYGFYDGGSTHISEMVFQFKDISEDQ